MSDFSIKNLVDSDFPEDAQPCAAVMAMNNDFSEVPAFSTFMLNSKGGDNYMMDARSNDLLSQVFPIVKGVVGKMVFRSVPAFLGMSTFRSDLSYDNIRDIVESYFQKMGMTCVCSKSTGSFTVVYERLQLEILVYLHESGYFILDIKRMCGDVFTASRIYSDLRRSLCNEASSDLDGEDSPTTVQASAYEVADLSLGKQVYDFDALMF